MRGDRLGPYRLLEPIGMGGHATVWLAQREDGDGNGRVALKVLHFELSDAKIRARFASEAETLRQLDGAGVVRILDAGVADGVQYLAMEYLERGSLAHWVGGVQPAQVVSANAPTAPVLANSPEPRKLTAKEIDMLCSWFASSAHGLALAHEHGILHRDVKPSNILIRDDATACLADFGVSLATGADRLTTEPGGIGTLAYMAPEQLRGEPATAASDVFSLCASFAEACCGGPGSFQINPMATTDRAGQWAAQLHGAGIAPLLTEILLRGLELDPRERYPRCALLAEDCEALRAGRLKHAWHPAVTTRLGILLHRRRRSIVAVGVGVGLVLGSLWYGARAGVRDLQLTRQQSQQLTEEAKKFIINPAHFPSASRALLELAARKDTTNAAPVQLLVEADIIDGDPARAVTRLQELDKAGVELSRPSRWTYARALYLAKGRSVRSSQPLADDPNVIVAELLATMPKAPTWLEIAAQVRHLLASGNALLALSLLETGQRRGDSPVYVELLARAYSSSDELERAAEIWRSWITINGQDWVAMLECAKLLARFGQGREASLLVERASKTPNLDQDELRLAQAVLWMHGSSNHDPDGLAPEGSREENERGCAEVRSLIGTYEARGLVPPPFLAIELARGLARQARDREAFVVLDSMPVSSRFQTVWRWTYVPVLAAAMARTRPDRCAEVLGMTPRAALDKLMGMLVLDREASIQELLVSARALMAIGKADEAAKLVEVLLAKAPPSASVFEIQAFVAQRQRKVEEEFEAFTKALALRKTDDRLRARVLHAAGKLLGTRFAKLGESERKTLLETAKAHRDRLLGSESPSVKVFEDSLALALVSNEKGEYEASLDIAIRGARLYPTSEPLRANWANLLQRLDRWSEAFDVLKPAVAAPTEYGDQLWKLYLPAALNTKRFEELLQSVKDLLEKVPSRHPLEPRTGAGLFLDTKVLENPRWPSEVRAELKRLLR